MNEEKIHISELINRQDLFKFDKNEKNVDTYLPVKDVFIQAINIETNETDWKKITKYTKHTDLNMYSIFDPLERFETFHVSDDHSMIVMDHLNEKLIKISPLDVMNDPMYYSLVKEVGDELIFINMSEIVIELDPNETVGFDFTVEDYYTFRTHDGVYIQDTMALFMPLSMESQEDCRKLMHIPGGTMNVKQSSMEIKHELILAAYIITDDSTPKSPDMGVKNLSEIRADIDIGMRPNHHVHQTLTIKLSNGKRIKTTLGRCIFNSMLPEAFLRKYYNGFIEATVNSKIMNDTILHDLNNEYDNIKVGSIVDTIIQTLGRYTSVYPNSLVLSEFIEVTMFDDLKEAYSKAKNINEKQTIINKIEDRIKNNIKKKMPMIHNIVASGSRGKPNQIRQVLVTKGLLQDAEGNFLSIDESYIDGLTPTSSFMGGYGARKGIMDRSRQTAKTGYLFRKLIYALASVMFNDEVTDCKTKKTIKTKITDKNVKLLIDRFIVDKNGLVKLTEKNMNDRYMNTYVNLRSPIYCKTHRLCKVCYGDLMYFYHSKYVGIIAAQAMGERGSQEMMKTFHTGGSADVTTPDLIQQALDNNPLLERSTIEKYVIQENTKFKVKGEYDITITLKQSDYFNIGITAFTVEDREKSKIVVDNMDIEGSQIKTALSIKPFVCTLSFSKGDNILDEFDLIIDDRVFLPIEYFTVNEFRDDAKIKTIILKANSKDLPFLINVELSSSDLSIVMETILGIIEKKNIMKHPEVAFNKLSKIYGDKFGIAYNHIEILISQLFRNLTKPEYPARLIEPYEAKVHGIKNIAHLESFLSGVLFENMSKSLLSGFVSDSTIQNPLEKLLSDDLDF